MATQICNRWKSRYLPDAIDAFFGTSNGLEIERRQISDTTVVVGNNHVKYPAEIS